MNKKFLLVHKISVALILTIFFAALVHFIFVLPSLPGEAGVHFDGDGNFDVYESKYYGFYPYIIGAVIISGLIAADQFIKKINIGIDLGEKGDALFRAATIFFTDIGKAVICVFSLNWSYAVENQQPLNTDILGLDTYILFGCFFLCPIVLLIVKKKFSQKNKTEDARNYHKMGRAMCWSLSAVTVPLMLVIWERFPSEKPTKDPFEYIYFADFGTYAPKLFYTAPAVLAFAVCIISSVILKKLGEKKGPYFVRTVDDISVILVFMMFSRMIIQPVIPMSPVFVIFCLGCCAASVIINYFRSRKNDKSE